MAQKKNPEKKRPRGRPSGPPSTIVHIRLPLALLERLDRYVDYELRWSHDRDINRATVYREALDAFLRDQGYPDSQAPLGPSESAQEAQKAAGMANVIRDLWGLDRSDVFRGAPPRPRGG